VPKADVNGIRLNYKVQGSGEPLLLIGGFNSEMITWFFQTGVFSKYFRIISFENRGSGKSSKPAGPYSVPTMVADTLGLLDYLKIKQAHILGVSMGGLIAQEFAINYPERVGKLILGTSYSCISDSSGPTQEMFQYTSLPVRKMLNPMADLMLNTRPYRMLLLPLARIKTALAHENSISGKLKAAYDHDTEERLKLIKARTLVITGENDRVIKPASSEIIAKLIPEARFCKVPNGSHMLFIEQRHEFNRAVLDFLRNS
jgi:3-oxoadipate enol-lactonase